MTEFCVEYVKPGAVLRWHYRGKEHPVSRLLHIRAIVDDSQIVYRYWSPNKGWIYKVDWEYFFWLMHTSDKLTVVKKGKS